MEKNRRREKNKALYISKLMYRGSIPKTSPFFCWRCCAPLYIAKLQDKALCRLNTRLQKEFTWENIKLKIFGKSVVRAWRNRGFKGISQCKRHIAKFSQGELLMMRSAIFSHHELIHLAKFSQCEIHIAKLVIWHDAVAFQRPYLPHFSSKSYTVWSLGSLTS